jgi:quinoprotein glucose dehydrogenase
LNAKLPVLLLIACSAAPLGKAGADWPEYLGGPGRSHYSELDQINRSNVSALKVAWEYHTGDPGQMQCNPIIVDGVLYGATASSQIFALDAATGAPLWRFTSTEKLDLGLANDRGVTYWQDGSDKRILCTIGSGLYALDARTGRPIPASASRAGRASRRASGPQAQEKWVLSTTPGTLYGDLLVMPTRVDEDQDAAPGYIQAFNVRTGTLAWTFMTIPYPGEPGYETWSKDAYKNIDVGSANCWAGMAIDRERGILYVPTGSAAPDFWGGHRLGQDLFADCLLALDAATGKLLWYHQGVHHDIWDRDLPSPPVLADRPPRGPPRGRRGQTTKTGFVFVFDRVTGEPLFPDRGEVPFPKSDARGRGGLADPAHPVELPKPYARQTLTEADISPYAENRDVAARPVPLGPHGALPALREGQHDPVSRLRRRGRVGGARGRSRRHPLRERERDGVDRLAQRPAQGGRSREDEPGRRLYTQYCIACHGPERKGLPAGGIPSLVDIGSRHSRDEVFKQITTGKLMMPGFGTLSKGEKDSIVATSSATRRRRRRGRRPPRPARARPSAFPISSTDTTAGSTARATRPSRRPGVH